MDKNYLKIIEYRDNGLVVYNYRKDSKSGTSGGNIKHLEEDILNILASGANLEFSSYIKDLSKIKIKATLGIN